jgi:hypothetical protein
VTAAELQDGALALRLRRTASLWPGQLLVAFESPIHGSVRWRIPLRAHSGFINIRDGITGQVVRKGTARLASQSIELRLPSSPLLSVPRIAVKVNRRFGFYDEAGWKEFTISFAAPLSCPAPSITAVSCSSASYASSSFGGGSAALD